MHVGRRYFCVRELSARSLQVIARSMDLPAANLDVQRRLDSTAIIPRLPGDPEDPNNYHYSNDVFWTLRPLCRGSETSLEECLLFPESYSRCYYGASGQSVGQLAGRPRTRLVSHDQAAGPGEGIVEAWIPQQQRWCALHCLRSVSLPHADRVASSCFPRSPICGASFQVEEAEVACAELGYSRWTATLVATTPVVKEPVYAGLACNGDERRLSDCLAPTTQAISAPCPSAVAPVIRCGPYGLSSAQSPRGRGGLMRVPAPEVGPPAPFDDGRAYVANSWGTSAPAHLAEVMCASLGLATTGAQLLYARAGTKGAVMQTNGMQCDVGSKDLAACSNYGRAFLTADTPLLGAQCRSGAFLISESPRARSPTRIVRATAVRLVGGPDGLRGNVEVLRRGVWRP